MKKGERCGTTFDDVMEWYDYCALGLKCKITNSAMNYGKCVKSGNINIVKHVFSMSMGIKHQIK